MVKKIGIFAGTFDPPHDGHLSFAHAALEMGLEKIMFLPEPRPRRKQGVKALEHRIAMVQLAIAKEPKFGTIVLEQARFTPHETLPVLNERFKGYKLVILFGDDVISHISAWPNVKTLLNNNEFIIASRHQDVPELKSTLDSLQKTTNININYHIVETNYKVTTSSEIRQSIVQKKMAIGLNPAVAEYITNNKLYTLSED